MRRLLQEMIAVCFFLYLIASVASKTTFDFRQIQQVREKISFTTFNRWMTIDAGSNNFSFYFNTTRKNVFLFYEQYYDSSMFIHGALVNGRVELTVRLNDQGCDHGKIIVPEEKNLADSKWHKVVTEFNKEEEMKLQVDDYATKTLRCGNSVISTEKTIQTEVFVGALRCDRNTDIVEMNFCSFDRDTRFVGCIGNVQIADRKGNIVDAKVRNPYNLTTGCSGQCIPSFCENNGRCLDRAATYECDCRGTGYNGELCDVEAASVWLNGTGYIAKNEGAGNSYLNDSLSFRFNTSAPHGVIMHTVTGNGDIFILELVNGTLVMRINLGGGKFVLEAGDGTLNDGNWHSVLLERKRHRVILKVDGKRFKLKPNTTGGKKYTKLDFSSKDSAIYFGGIPMANLSSESLAKRNFSGILQQLVFRNIDILQKALNNRQLSDYVGDITSYGNVLNASEFINSEEFEGSGNCSNTDDEDGCATTTDIDETEESTTETSTKATRSTFPKSPGTFYVPTAVVEAQNARPVHAVSAWVIIAIVTAAIVAILITVFVVYYWNNRYSGSFKPKGGNSSSVPSPERENTRGYEQPAFYVSSKKPEKNQPFNNV